MRGSSKMRRLIYLCEWCDGEGCTACDHSGQYGRDVRIAKRTWEDVKSDTDGLSLKNSDKGVLERVQINVCNPCSDRPVTSMCLFDLQRSCKMLDVLDWVSMQAPPMTTNAFAVSPFLPTNAANNGGVCNAVNRGNTLSNRIGKSFVNIALHISAVIFPGSNCGSRIVLLWDNAPAQAATIPTPSVIFTSLHGITSMISKDQIPRFEILRDYKFQLAQNTITTSHLFEEVIDLKNRVTTFNEADTTGLYSNMLHGALILYQMNSGGAGNVVHQVSVRLFFSDP